MEWLALGLALGLGAGVSPGPLLALVMANSLRGGFSAGAFSALAPLLTDLFIVSLTVRLLVAMPAYVVAGLGVVGGIFVIGLGLEAALSARRADPVAASRLPSKVIAESALVNLLSPHPWLFWLTAGGPLLLSAYRSSLAGAVGFVAGFYLLLVGSKVAIAAVVAAAGHRLSATGYRRALALSAGLLLIAGVVLVVRFLPQLLAY